MADSVSPGSSQRGASVTWNAHVTWPSGPAASAVVTAPTSAQIESSSTAAASGRAIPRFISESRRIGLNTGASQDPLDVLGLGLPRAGVDLADGVDGRRRDGRGHALLATLRHHVAVHVGDLGRSALGHVFPHREPPVAPAARGRRELPPYGIV